MLNELNDSLSLIIASTQANFFTLGIILGILWGIFILNNIVGKRLFYLGLLPRHVASLGGIFFSPFLHANFNHLFFNSIPLLVLSDFLLIGGLAYFLTVTLFIIVISGLLTWCFGQKGIHIGASGVITGYWALLVMRLFHEGGPTTFILGALSIYYFAGIFMGIFPGKKGVSWDGHLFGLIAGISTSFLI